MPKILFLCPHNAAKSVLAVAYFNRLAEGTDFYADSAGTEPDAIIMPSVAEHLRTNGLPLPEVLPRHVTPADIAEAHRVISMGCDELDLPTTKSEQWVIPPVSQNLPLALGAIEENLAQLWAKLQEEHA